MSESRVLRQSVDGRIRLQGGPIDEAHMISSLPTMDSAERLPPAYNRFNVNQF